MVNCNSIAQMPDVTFHIHGQQFTLPASAYVRQVNAWFPARLRFSSHRCASTPSKNYSPHSSHSLSTMAAVPALATEVTACGSWVMSSSGSTIPSSTEPRTWWVWPGLDNQPEVTLQQLCVHLSAIVEFKYCCNDVRSLRFKPFPCTINE